MLIELTKSVVADNSVCVVSGSTVLASHDLLNEVKKDDLIKVRSDIIRAAKANPNISISYSVKTKKEIEYIFSNYADTYQEYFSIFKSFVVGWKKRIKKPFYASLVDDAELNSLRDIDFSIQKFYWRSCPLSQAREMYSSLLRKLESVNMFNSQDVEYSKLKIYL